MHVHVVWSLIQIPLQILPISGARSAVIGNMNLTSDLIFSMMLLHVYTVVSLTSDLNLIEVHTAQLTYLSNTGNL